MCHLVNIWAVKTSFQFHDSHPKTNHRLAEPEHSASIAQPLPDHELSGPRMPLVFLPLAEHGRGDVTARLSGQCGKFPLSQELEVQTGRR